MRKFLLTRVMAQIIDVQVMSCCAGACDVPSSCRPWGAWCAPSQSNKYLSDVSTPFFVIVRQLAVGFFAGGLVGLGYLDMQGNPPNMAAARQAYEAAAAMGNAEAHFNLGAIYGYF